MAPSGTAIPYFKTNEDGTGTTTLPLFIVAAVKQLNNLTIRSFHIYS